MRTLNKGWRTIVSVLSIALVVFQVYTSFFGVFDDLIQRGVHVAFVLTLVFIVMPARKGKSRADGSIDLIDYIFIAVSVTACVYIISVRNTVLWYPMKWLGLFDKLMAYLLVIAIWEACRRAVGLVFVVISFIFILYGQLGPYIPSGLWSHKGIALDTMFQQLYHTTNGIWGTYTGLAATMLAMFGVFGAVLGVSGGAETIIQVGRKLVGKTTGGSGKIAVISAGIFGMFSGSAIANAMATGTFTIPMMTKDGYSKRWAAATVANSASGGMLMPPVMGAAAFVMAHLIGVDYYDICITALFPAFLYYMSLLLCVHYVSKRLGILGSKEKTAPISLRNYIILFGPLVVFMILVALRFSAMVAACYAAIIGFAFYIAFSGKFFGKGVKETGRALGSAVHSLSLDAKSAILNMTMIMLSAQVAIVFIQSTGFAVKMSTLIVSLGQQNLFLSLVLAMIVVIILGMGLPATASYAIGASVLVSPLVQLGVPTMVANFFVFYFSILSGITPPVCATIYTTAAMAKESWFKSALLACFMGLPLFILPYSFTYCTGLLLLPGSTVFETGVAFVSAVIGAYAIALSVAGFYKHDLKLVVRVIYAVAGVIMICPFKIGSLVAIAVFAVLFAIDFVRSRKLDKERLPA